jgi:ligand-binding sensor domain-containing protein
MIVRVFLLIFTCCWALSLSAQSLSYQQFTVEDGLPSSEVYHCIQDAEGFMWFATDRGVARFDGYEFEVFTTDNGLVDNVVFQMHQDYEGRIWFVSYSLRLCFYKDGEFFEYGHNQKIQDEIGTGIKSSFHVDREGNIHLGLIGKGYFKISSVGKITNMNNAEPQYSHTNFREIEEVPFWHQINSGNSTSGKGSTVTNTQITHYPSSGKKEYLLTNSLSASGTDTRLCKYGDQTYITHSSVLNLCERGEIKKDLYDVHSPINAVFVDENNVWLGSFEKGLMIFNRYGDFLKPDYHELNGTSVSHVFKDEDGGYWVTTLEGGVYYTGGLQNIQYTKQDGIPDNYISSISGNQEGQTIVGTRTGSIAIINNGVIEKTYDLPTDHKGEVSKILYRSDIKEYTVSGLGVYKYLNGQLDPYVRHGSPMDFIYDQEGQFIAVRRGVWTVQDGEMILLDTNNIENYQCITQLKDGTIILGNMLGLFRVFDGGVEKIVGTDSLLTQRVVDLQQVAGFKYVAATRGVGIVFVDMEDDATNVSMDHGLASNQINSFHVENDSIIWVATSSGISRVVTTDFSKTRTFTTKHGLLSNEVTSIYTSNGVIWIGTKKGLNRMQIDALLQLKKPFPVIVKSVVGAQGNNIDFSKEINLEYDQSYLGVLFAALNFQSTGEIDYRYRMVGVFDGWVITQSNNLQFPYIPSGEYTLEISAANEDGVWSEKPFEIKINVATPFWTRWEFFAMLVILIIVAAVAIHTTRINRIKEKARL